MSTIPFCKFHGFGNDYIVIERVNIPESGPLSDLAVAICHRNTGVGSDGIAVIEKISDDDADFFCEIVNPDGSVAGFSGNGTRCAVSHLYYKDLWQRPDLRLKTRSGVKKYHLIESVSEGSYLFEAEIGQPEFASNRIPVEREHSEVVIDNEIDVNGRIFLFSAINVGNPVACIFVDDFDFDWRTYGKAMETHPLFPERANIVFVRVIDKEYIELRIWERGAGETSASGTCSSGAAVLSAFTGKTGRQVFVLSPGGTTKVDWREDGEILLTGRADLAFCGEWPVD
ncbi:MAG TPA: diaminopimelate epimerase [Pyrinomonadaceae bacterium]|nr:diaminopimelate epimerase [Pyrinomonadaceae bacterium]